MIVSPSSLNNWRGLNERKIIGTNPAETTSLDNVNIRNGVVEGRRGINEWDDIATAETDTPIIGLMDHYSTASSASSLLRMGPLTVRKWNSASHVWDDITGTALTGTATTRPQFCQVSELNYLGFTNEGADRPRKYTGSGNTAVWGGTPPYCKAIEYYVGFLALGHISNDASIWFPLDLIFSDDPDNTWEECDDTSVYVTTLTLDETPGEIRALKVLGPTLYAYKADGIVAVRFTGGPVRFQRQEVDFPMGILAPLSLQSLGEMGHIFMASDRNLYILNSSGKVTAAPNNVQKTLQETLPAAKAPYVRSMVDYGKETYILAYQRSGSSYMDATIEFNYRTGEFTRKLYPVEFNSMLAYKQTLNSDVVRLASSSTLTYQLETGTNDNGTALSRYFDVDWNKLGVDGTKYVAGAEFVFEKARDCRVKISIAVDKSGKFQYGKWYDLRGSDPLESQVRVAYDIPSPVHGTWFKFRVEMFHDSSTNVVKLLEFQPELVVGAKASVDTPRAPSAVRL
jgi:hypothetical protein